MILPKTKHFFRVASTKSGVVKDEDVSHSYRPSRPTGIKDILNCCMHTGRD